MADLGLGKQEMLVLFSAQSGEGKGELWKAIDRVFRTEEGTSSEKG
jgi:hypothetical protein